MAEGNGTERVVTDRVVLRRVSVLVVPEGADPEKLGEAIRLLMPAKGRSKVEDAATEGWIVVDERAGASKRQSIVAHTGEPGTSDAKVGTFKAVPVSNWKGGIVLEAPPKPLVMASEFED